MAIALDNASTGATQDSGSSSVSFNHTVTSNTNGVLFVAFSYSASPSAVTVTYNSVTLTRVTGAPAAATSTYHQDLWYLFTPATGTHSVTISFTGASPAILYDAISLTGVDTSGIDTQNVTNGSAFGTVGGSVTASANAWLVDSFGIANDTATITHSTGTQLFNVDNTLAARRAGGEYTGPITGSTAMQWSISGSTNRSWGQVIASVKPPSSAISLNVSDTVAVTESVQDIQTYLVNVSDTVGSSESLNTALAHQINVSDSTSLTESAKAEVNNPVSVSDATTVTESITGFVPFLVPNLSDSTTVTESVGMLLVSLVTTADSTALTENVALVFAVLVSVSDSVSVTESAVLQSATNIVVSDSTTVSESFVNGGAPNPSVSDSTTLSEALLLNDTDGVAVMDSPSVAESVTVVLSAPQVSVSDPNTVSESVGRQVDSYANRSDAVSTTESTQLSPFTNVAVSDAASIIENVTLVVQPTNTPLITVSDSTSLSDTTSFGGITSGVYISDNLTVNEALTVSLFTYPLPPYRIRRGARGTIGPRGTRGSRSHRGPRSIRHPRVVDR